MGFLNLSNGLKSCSNHTIRELFTVSSTGGNQIWNSKRVLANIIWGSEEWWFLILQLCSAAIRLEDLRLHRLQPWSHTNVTVNFNRTQISHLVVYVTLWVCVWVCVPETAQKRMSDITKTLSVCLNLIPAVAGQPSSKTTYVKKEINDNIPPKGY